MPCPVGCGSVPMHSLCPSCLYLGRIPGLYLISREIHWGPWFVGLSFRALACWVKYEIFIEPRQAHRACRAGTVGGSVWVISWGLVRGPFIVYCFCFLFALLCPPSNYYMRVPNRWFNPGGGQQASIRQLRPPRGRARGSLHGVSISQPSP